MHFARTPWSLVPSSTSLCKSHLFLSLRLLNVVKSRGKVCADDTIIRSQQKNLLSHVFFLLCKLLSLLQYKLLLGVSIKLKYNQYSFKWFGLSLTLSTSPLHMCAGPKGGGVRSLLKDCGRLGRCALIFLECSVNLFLLIFIRKSRYGVDNC